MQLTTLFSMQKQLDAYIQSNRETTSDVFREKGLALLVELGELANETRSFKFWSTKGPSETSIILEEYVDSIHFLLSLGIEKGLDTILVWPEGEITGELTELFIKTTEAIVIFLKELSLDAYEAVWVHYGAIAAKLGFSHQDIIQAYIAKNEENYERQKNGY